MPFPRQDEDAIEIYTGVVLTQELDFVADTLNYSAVTTMLTELYQVDLTNFMQLVQGSSLALYKKTLVCLSHDSAYRLIYLSNRDWQKA